MSRKAGRTYSGVIANARTHSLHPFWHRVHPHAKLDRSVVLGGARHWRTIWHMCRQTLSYAVTLLQLIVPTLHVRAIIRNLHFQRMTEVHNGDSRDVCDREPVSRCEPVFRQLLVELSMESFNP